VLYFLVVANVIFYCLELDGVVAESVIVFCDEVSGLCDDEVPVIGYG